MSTAEDAAKKALSDNPDIVSEWCEEVETDNPDLDARERESCVGFLAGYGFSWARKSFPESLVTFESVQAAVRNELHAHKRSTLS